MALMKVGDKKLDTTDWKAIPFDLWKTTTFRAYCEHLNKEAFGMACMTRNVQGENGQMSRDIKKYGREAVKKFIELGVKGWNSNQNYPTCSYSQLRVIKFEQLMPLAVKAVEDNEKALESSIKIDELGEMF